MMYVVLIFVVVMVVFWFLWRWYSPPPTLMCALSYPYSAANDGGVPSSATNFLPDGKTPNPHLAELKRLEEAAAAAVAGAVVKGEA